MLDMEEIVTERQDTETNESVADRNLTMEWNATWFGGLVLIVIGSAFLIQNLTGYWFENWWALFIAIPGVFALMGARRLYEQNGQRFTGQVATAAAGALFPLLIAAIFLFQLNWGKVWPLFLIAAGVLALLPQALPKR